MTPRLTGIAPLPWHTVHSRLPVTVFPSRLSRSLRKEKNTDLKAQIRLQEIVALALNLAIYVECSVEEKKGIP